MGSLGKQLEHNADVAVLFDVLHARSAGVMANLNQVRFVRVSDIANSQTVVCVPNNEPTEIEFKKRNGSGKTYNAVIKRARSPKFHNLVMRVIRDLFENQDTYSDIEVFRVVIKLKCGWVYEEPVVTGKGQVQWVPKPTDWSNCDEDEFREFFDKLKPIVWEKLGEEAWSRYRL